ncbi:hypothetical protein [Psychromarinibacter sp. S121]|uniref:hypothetical protein n=1 Tax=Psychromarinibacter sp. S121 TaxID=3415127 RepID=UPI003C7E369F
MFTEYRIDRNSRITWVCGNWDASTTRNGASQLTSSSVIGRLLWDFVSGRDTRDYLQAIFHWAHGHDITLHMSYRCDTPEEERYYRMSVRRAGDDEVGVKHRLLQRITAPNPPQFSLHDGQDSSARCSVCCRYQVGDAWIDPYRTGDQMWMRGPFTVCPDCRGTALDTIRYSLSADISNRYGPNGPGTAN